jgi:DNA invertase Pin-like site-specific DNA recombinase
MGWPFVEFVDSGVSGSKERRPQLDLLMKEASLRKFDAVVVWKFDRFARSVSHLLRALDTFQSKGIEFISLSENLDTSTPQGRMVFTVLGAVAELERSLIVERVRCGLRNAKAKGVILGRRTTLKPEMVHRLKASGKSNAQIAEQLKITVQHVRRLARTVAGKTAISDSQPLTQAPIQPDATENQ